MSCMALKLREQDNVATVLTDLKKGDVISVLCYGVVECITALDDIHFGFKVSTESINTGCGVIKYGEIIGRASADIKTGEMVHIHNVEGARGRGDMKEENNNA
ncbi:UxaA family hydrolase [Salmonella enterica]|uniref:UxaA family hydrolase n=1 Tax=Salmonella enterica TaxID=28901 RepID=UPI003D323DC8